MSIYWICVIPGLIWLAALTLAADRINSLKIALLFDLSAVVCFLTGLGFYYYHFFPVNDGFFAVIFAVPLIYLGCFELFRLFYMFLRHQMPCINVRSGRWLGDKPIDGFFTKYPPEKVISWSDVLFGISQMMIPVFITMILMICSLALAW